MRPQVIDIVPDPGGWAVLIRGRATSCYYSLQLALEAAAAKSEGSEQVLIRRLDSDGKFYDVETGHAA